MLSETGFHSEDVPAPERLDWWRELVRRMYGPMELDADRTADLHGHARLVELGAVSVWAAQLPPLSLRRTTGPRPASARRTGSVSHRLSLLLDGDAVIVRGTSEVPFRAGDFYFHDPLRPYGIRTGSVRVIGVGMPEALLPLPRGRVDAVLGRLVPGRHGMGTLLARFLSKLTADTSVYQPSDGPRLGTVLGDLVAALCTQAMADGRSVPPGDCGGTLAVRIEAFIQQHLREAELTPRTVAAAHGISPSYLHRLFQEKGETVAASIRRQRLERARYDLADPAQDGTPVAAVAARWGFPRATDFARAFRAAYGITPTEYRKRAHEGHGSQAGHAGQEGRTGHDGGGRIAT